ncbi:hypothetical protein L0U85_17785 [Glycomyces sp. L485]|nr:hypothetical protein [Glycomyces sp. L485]MCH7232688.1 hypothetical protein [Glycomyces sp. L485]
MVLLFYPVLAVVGSYVLYRTIRTAVRDAIEDSDERRSGSDSEGRNIDS